MLEPHFLLKLILSRVGGVTIKEWGGRDFGSALPVVAVMSHDSPSSLAFQMYIGVRAGGHNEPCSFHGNILVFFSSFGRDVAWDTGSAWVRAGFSGGTVMKLEARTRC